MKLSIRKVLAITFVAAAALVTLTALPAEASSPHVSAADPSCWYNTDTKAFACYQNEARLEAAIRSTEGGPVVFAPAGRLTASSVQPFATYVLATFYADVSYGGATLQITTSISTLCATHQYGADTMPAGWDARVSSFHSYGTCKSHLYSQVDRQGVQYGPAVNASSLGVMNDQTRSYDVAQ